MAGRLPELAESLKVIASTTRLELLHVLRTPRPLHAIEVQPSLNRGSENPERPLSRQTVTHHLHVLQRAGLVYRHQDDESVGRGDSYVLNHERVFALVDELRDLAKLSPAAWTSRGVFSTIERSEGSSAPLPPPPRLLLAYGRDDGVGFPLSFPGKSRLTVGRAKACDVCLDYDPYVSTEHAAIHHHQGRFTLEDLSSRNGVLVNWQPLESGGKVQLRAGDLVVMGRSVLVFQA